MSIDVDLHVDVCGMCCPVPLIQLANSIKSLRPGQTLEIIGNDPIFESAVHNFCQNNGHTVSVVTTGANYSLSFLIKVGG
jgi:TusA-related sulfurtransferase